MNRAPDWGMIGRSAVLTSLVGAIILFFAIPDQRWIAAVLLGVAISTASSSGSSCPASRAAAPAARPR